MISSLDESLNAVEWGRFKVGNLFEIHKVRGVNKSALCPGNDFDYVTRTSNNQGVLTTSGAILNVSPCPPNIWSFGLLQCDFFFRNKPWYAGQFVRQVVPRFSVTPAISAFFTVALSKLKKQMQSVLVRNIDARFLDSYIKLPVTSDDAIDFSWMEHFMSQVHTTHTEKFRSWLFSSSYFENFGKGSSLSTLRQRLSAAQWTRFQIGDLFERVVSTKLPYKAHQLPTVPTTTHTLPCLTSSFNNQGLNYYVPKEGATVLHNVISLPSNSDVYRAYFQPHPFTVLSDAYAIRWKGSTHISQHCYLFLVTCINKATDLPIFSYKEKLGGWNVVKHLEIVLPTNAEGIDFSLMEDLIASISGEMANHLAINFDFEKLR